MAEELLPTDRVPSTEEEIRAPRSEKYADAKTAVVATIIARARAARDAW